MIVYKLFGGKIVWTIHNKYPHNSKYIKLNKLLRIFIAKISNKLHVHCHSAIDIMSSILNAPKNKFFVVQHPMYEVQIHAQSKSRLDLYQKYNISTGNKTIFLVFGLIAEYKGIEDVADIIKDLPNSLLLIAGKIKTGNNEYHKKISFYKNFENIFIIDKLIPSSDLGIFFNSSNYVVFNYRDILTSGGVHLAQSYEKNIIACNKGCIKDIHSKNVIKFDNLKDLKSILIEKNDDSN